MSCFIFHKWGKWEHFEEGYKVKDRRFPGEVFDKTRLVQRRVCSDCGKIEQEVVYG